MSLAGTNLVIQDEAGNIVDGALVRVRRLITGLPLAEIYSDRDGSNQLANPFTAADGASVPIFAQGGAYQITASKGSFSRTWPYVPIGTNSEFDFGTVFTPRGAWSGDSPAPSYNLGDVVSHQVDGSDIYAFASNENDNAGNEPVFEGSPLEPASDDHWTVLGLLEAPGTPGAPGEGLTPQGAWSGAATYEIGDYVSYNGRTFVSLVDDNLNHTPPSADEDDAYWMFVPVVQGATGATGSTGATGDPGADGDNAYVYIAYAADDSGTGFTLTFNPALDYIAILATDTEIVSPSAGDFAGLWKNYKGAQGEQGIQGEQGEAGEGSGNVNTTGAPVTAGNLVQYDDTSGDVIEDSGLPAASVATIGKAAAIAIVFG